jgi:hypothetical protein
LYFKRITPADAHTRAYSLIWFEFVLGQTQRCALPTQCGRLPPNNPNAAKKSQFALSARRATANSQVLIGITCNGRRDSCGDLSVW